MVRMSSRISSRRLASRLASGSSSRRTPRLHHEGPRQCHALLLAAGQFLGSPLAQAGQPHQLQHLAYPPVDLVPGYSLHAEAEADVIGHVQVGEQEVLLEDHDGAAPLCGYAADGLAVEEDVAGRGG